VGAQRRPLKGMPDRHDNHLVNFFFFNEFNKNRLRLFLAF
jgi:hypothetical protein